MTEERYRKRKIYQVTLLGSLGNVVLLLFKFSASILGNSTAMLADAVHSLSDFITDLLVLLFVHISSKPQDKGHDYGHGKYETLATALISIMLLIVGIGILCQGLGTIYSFLCGEPLETPGGIALAAAIVSIALKEGLFQYTLHIGKKVSSPAMIANAWHHRSDALSSIGTTLGIGGAILLGGKWAVLDPVAAVVVSLFILKVAFTLTRTCLEELMEKSLPEEVERDITKTLLQFPEVSAPHNLRTRRIGNRVAVEVHIRMDGGMTVSASHEITSQMEKKLRELLGEHTFINIHVEPLKKD